MKITKNNDVSKLTLTLEGRHFSPVGRRKWGIFSPMLGKNHANFHPPSQKWLHCSTFCIAG